MKQTPTVPPNLLLLSNSRSPNGDYLVHARKAMVPFAGQRRRALFFPFAAVTMDWGTYLETVQQALHPIGITLTGAHRSRDIGRSIAEADLLLVGGGNTFRLLHELRIRGCLEAIRAAVSAGAHYIGWSAGSVVATPSIRTTNDMPIVDPGGLDALGLVRFQINAHYNNALPPGHQGETRNQRLAEYLAMNPRSRVVGLPEGNWMEVRGESVSLHGPHTNFLFLAGTDPASMAAGPLVFPPV